MTDEQNIPAGPNPERMDMDMRANADVQWSNPDALTRDQTIRSMAINLAITGAGRGLEVSELLDFADDLATYIRDGSVRA